MIVKVDVQPRDISPKAVTPARDRFRPLVLHLAFTYPETFPCATPNIWLHTSLTTRAQRQHGETHLWQEGDGGVACRPSSCRASSAVAQAKHEDRLQAADLSRLLGVSINVLSFRRASKNAEVIFDCPFK